MIIRSKLIFFFFLFTLPFSLTAQEPSVVDIGVRIGGNASFIRNVEDRQGDGDGLLFGLAAGVWLRLNIPSSPVFLQSELLYSQSGGEFPGGPFLGSPDLEITQNLLDTPFFIGVRFGSEESVKSRIYTGLSTAVVLTAKSEEKSSTSQSSSEDIKSFMQSPQLGGVLGAGLDVGMLSIDFRYQHYLSGMFEDLPLATGKEANVSFFQLSAGFKLQ